MSWAALWDYGSYALPPLGLLTIWWLRDRRKDAAAAEIAEQTVPAEVGLKETGALEARLVYVQREMDLERVFHRTQLADRDTEIARQRAELDHRDQIIARCRTQIEDLQTRLDGATRQLNSVRDQLEELAGLTPPPCKGE